MSISVEQVDEWLVAKGVTLWADWEVTHPVQRRKAAEWFVGQMKELVSHVYGLEESQ